MPVIDANFFSPPRFEKDRPAKEIFDGMVDRTDFNDLLETFAFAWAYLAAGVGNRRLGSHVPTLASVNLEGLPEVRTVVLRACDPDARLLRFNSDRRSSKIEDFRKTPSLAFHIYDAGLKLQLRLRGEAEIHQEDVQADAAWETSREMSRHCYQVTEGPGSRIDEPGGYRHDPDTTEGGWSNFLTVQARINSLECLYLDHAGHRRSRFDYEGGAEGKGWHASWLVP